MESRLIVRERVPKCTVDGEECSHVEDNGVLFLRDMAALTGRPAVAPRWWCWASCEYRGAFDFNCKNGVSVETGVDVGIEEVLELLERMLMPVEPNIGVLPSAPAVSVESVSEFVFSSLSVTRGELAVGVNDDEHEDDDDVGSTGIGGGGPISESPRSKRSDEDDDELLLPLRINVEDDEEEDDDIKDSCECPVADIDDIFVGDSLVPDEATISDDDTDVDIGEGSVGGTTADACAGADIS